MLAWGSGSSGEWELWYGLTFLSASLATSFLAKLKRLEGTSGGVQPCHFSL